MWLWLPTPRRLSPGALALGAVAGFRTPLSLIQIYTRQQPPDPWQQLAVVSPADAICYVVAAGSGKTTVLTARIALLMPPVGAPNAILAGRVPPPASPDIATPQRGGPEACRVRAARAGASHVVAPGSRMATLRAHRALRNGIPLR
jgi:hypothetical protein